MPGGGIPGGGPPRPIIGGIPGGGIPGGGRLKGACPGAEETEGGVESRHSVHTNMSIIVTCICTCTCTCMYTHTVQMYIVHTCTCTCIKKSLE